MVQHAVDFHLHSLSWYHINGEVVCFYLLSIANIQKDKLIEQETRQTHNSTMRELPTEKLLIYGCSFLLVMVLTPLLSRIPRSKGNKIASVVYLIGVVATVMFLPEFIQGDEHNWMFTCCATSYR